MGAMLANVLVLNCGSATVKFKLYAVQPSDGPLQMLRLQQHATLSVADDYDTVLQQVLRALPIPPDLIAHRVVHGGSQFHEPTSITPRVLQALADATQLAPLHNRPAMLGIHAAAALQIPMVAVFDTTFHQTMPEHAYTYALPEKWRHDIRRYGFHGLSHRYVTQRVGELLGVQRPTLISLHLGGGASACAVQAGKSVDTSMGFGPLEGLMMATRCGDIDPTVVLHLMRHLNSTTAVDNLLNKESGVLGVAGTADMKEVCARHDETSILAREMYAYRLRKYLGSYLAVLQGGTQAVVFTGGVGENAPMIRELALRGFEWAGIALDLQRNTQAQGESLISSEASSIPVYVIPTDEEMVIAQDALQTRRNQHV